MNIFWFYPESPVFKSQQKNFGLLILIQEVTININLGLAPPILRRRRSKNV
jgi:hypothetical protein